MCDGPVAPMLGTWCFVLFAAVPSPRSGPWRSRSSCSSFRSSSCWRRCGDRARARRGRYRVQHGSRQRRARTSCATPDTLRRSCPSPSATARSSSRCATRVATHPRPQPAPVLERARAGIDPPARAAPRGSAQAGPVDGGFLSGWTSRSCRDRLVADEDALVRSGLRAILAGEEDLEVVAEAADGEDASRQVVATDPDAS